MKEKIYHPTNKPIYSCTFFRRKREEHWIRQLGTAAPYGCKDHIDSIGNLTSPGCKSVNVLNLFDQTRRWHRSHGSRRYKKPEIRNVSFDGLMPFVNLQLGLHHIRTRLYSLPLKTLHVLYEYTLTLHFTDVGSPEHRLQGIILDISSNRLFKVVRLCDSIETKNRPFLKIKFAKKGIDALNLRNILNQKSVQSNIPPYLEYKESPCIGCYQNFQLQNKSVANRLPKSFSESLTLFLLWLWVSLCSMWPFSDRWSQYRTKWQTSRSFTQGTEI